MDPAPPTVLRFDRGTLLLEHVPDGEVPDGFVFDARVQLWRAPAIHYHRVVMDLHTRKLPYDDQARAYTVLGRRHRSERVPRDYQEEAVEIGRAHV